jgi:hypothetical protein
MDPTSSELVHSASEGSPSPKTNRFMNAIEKIGINENAQISEKGCDI